MEEKKYIQYPCEKPNFDQMIGYKAPIDVLMGAVRDDFDGRIFRAVQMADIEVDRDELIKALQYDRGQYEKGYNDGGKVAAKEIFEAIFYDCWAIKDENGHRVFDEGKIKDFAKKCYGVELN